MKKDLIMIIGAAIAVILTIAGYSIYTTGTIDPAAQAEIEEVAEDAIKAAAL